MNSPLMLGFEHFERTLERVAKLSAEGYPPYNIEQVTQTRLRITLAVAGFAEADLSVEREDDQLRVAGRQQDKPGDENRLFLHRGIAARQFQRSFVLADGIEVEGAQLQDGLLHIDLTRPAPDKTVQRIKIRAPKAGEGGAPLSIARDSDSDRDPR
jgi:HSP20 family molecular chaperone IbpA